MCSVGRGRSACTQLGRHAALGATLPAVTCTHGIAAVVTCTHDITGVDACTYDIAAVDMCTHDIAGVDTCTHGITAVVTCTHSITGVVTCTHGMSTRVHDPVVRETDHKPVASPASTCTHRTTWVTCLTSATERHRHRRYTLRLNSYYMMKLNYERNLEL